MELLGTEDPSLVSELAAVLGGAGFSGPGVRDALGSTGDFFGRPSDLALAERRLGQAGALSTLVRLFVLELPISAGEARKAFGPLSLSHLERLALIAQEGADVYPLVRIVPHDETLIVADLRLQPGDARSDHVAGVQGPSLTLSHLTVRRPVETALDIGTGCGIQAILAARTSGRVVATDLNERALAFTRFNALLNGLGNIEVRAGSLFEPVREERFGLVTCNPPYVISPESAFLYRDSGMEGDRVSREVVQKMPGHLAEGAFSTTLVSWVDAPGEDWSTPLRAWVGGSGCDAWLLHYATDDPLTHAAQWNRERHGHDTSAFGEVLDRWLAYFTKLGIEGIAYGAIILRRREGANWVRADEMPAERLQAASDHILRVFDAQDFLAGLPDDAALLDETIALAERDVLEQHAVLRDGTWGHAGASVTLDEGLGFRATLDPATAELLADLDGRRPLRRVVSGLAARQMTSHDMLARSALPVIRGMLGAGFLVRS